MQIEVFNLLKLNPAEIYLARLYIYVSAGTVFIAGLLFKLYIDFKCEANQ